MIKRTRKPLRFTVGQSSMRHPLYADPRWRALRQLMIDRHGEQCMARDHNPKHPLSKARGAHIVLDHIKEVRDRPDLALDPNNVILLCKHCHSAKTVREVKDRNQREDAARYVRMMDRTRSEQAEAEAKSKAEPSSGDPTSDRSGDLEKNDGGAGV